MMKLTILTLATAAAAICHLVIGAPEAPPPRPQERLGDEMIMHRGFLPDFKKNLYFNIPFRGPRHGESESFRES